MVINSLALIRNENPGAKKIIQVLRCLPGIQPILVRAPPGAISKHRNESCA